jgi:hypothetical protein
VLSFSSDEADAVDEDVIFEDGVAKSELCGDEKFEGHAQFEESGEVRSSDSINKHAC